MSTPDIVTLPITGVSAEPDTRAMLVLTRYAEAQRGNARKVRVVLGVVFAAAVVMFVCAPVLNADVSEDLEAVFAVVFLLSFTVCSCGIIIAVGFAIFRQPMLDDFIAA